MLAIINLISDTDNINFNINISSPVWNSKKVKIIFIVTSKKSILLLVK